MNYYVYVIASFKYSQIKTYVGWTKDLKKRLKMHNMGKGAKSTKGRIWKVIHYEVFNSKITAMKREYYLKKDKIFRKKLKESL